FYIRTGKLLKATQTEVRVVFKEPPNLGFISLERMPEPDQFVIKLDPSTGAQLTMEARRGDRKKAQPVPLDLEFAHQGGEGATPYEVLLQAAIEGDSARFKRQDVVEENWRSREPRVG